MYIQLFFLSERSVLGADKCNQERSDIIIHFLGEVRNSHRTKFLNKRWTKQIKLPQHEGLQLQQIYSARPLNMMTFFLAVGMLQ